MLHYWLVSQEGFINKWWHVLKPCLNSKNTSLKATTKLNVESNCDKKNSKKINYDKIFLFIILANFCTQKYVDISTLIENENFVAILTNK